MLSALGCNYHPSKNDLKIKLSLDVMKQNIIKSEDD